MLNRPDTSGLTDGDFADLLAQLRPFLLRIANDEVPADLRAKGGASDLVQEALASALRCRHQFRGETLDDLRAWLRSILKNELAAFHRRYAAVAARDVSREVPAELAAPLAADSPPAVETLIRDEERDALSEAVARLPENMRAVVVLHFENEMTFADIGRQLGRSEESARKAYSRALERLQGILPGSDH